MYTAYFGFNSKPFKPKDSKDYYRNANFDGACADILDGIRERRGFILLTGEAGVGKTLVLRRCMQEADDVRFVLLGNANLDFPDILNYLSASLELPTDGLDPDQRPRLLLDALLPPQCLGCRTTAEPPARRYRCATGGAVVSLGPPALFCLWSKRCWRALVRAPAPLRQVSR